MSDIQSISPRGSTRTVVICESAPEPCCRLSKRRGDSLSCGISGQEEALVDNRATWSAPQPIHSRCNVTAEMDWSQGSGRTSVGPKPGIRKKRGRPLLNARDDETPEERRRTQLRLAQRAHAKRKEWTISQLQGKVAQLKSLATDMNYCFIHFRDRAKVSGLLACQPHLESELEKTASQIIDLLGTVAFVNSDDHGKENRRLRAPRPLPGAETKILGSDIYVLSNPPPPPLCYPTASDAPQNEIKTPELPFGLTLEYEEKEAEANEYPNDETLTTAAPPLASFANPAPPFTHSHLELTFANRLERANVERSVHLLATARLRPAEHARVFRLCRHFCAPPTLASKLRAALARRALAPSASMALGVGGAGLHFASSFVGGGLLAGIRPRTQEENVRVAGERLRAVGLRLTPELAADLRHYQGVWFDSRDVEIYLRALGIRVDARASVVEVDAAVLDGVTGGWFGEGGVVDASAGAVRGRGLQYADLVGSSGWQEMRASGVGEGFGGYEAAGGYHADTIAEEQGVCVAAAADGAPVAPIQPADELSDQDWDRFCNFSTPWLADNWPPRKEGTPTISEDSHFAAGHRTTAMVDLDTLIKRLIRHATCIGSGPGFRREDVHAALRAAVVDD